MMIPEGVPRAPASMRQQLRDEFDWPPRPDFLHVPGLPQPETPARLSIREAMGSVPIGTK